MHNYTIKHVDDKHLATPASCTTAAKYYYSCTCDENGTTTFNDGTPLSHNEFAEIAEDRYFKSAATCLIPTTYYKSCTGCGLEGTSTFTVGQALGHIEQIVSGYAATCTTTGLTDGITCSRCNEIVQMQMIINALGHEEVITKGKEATCTTSGVTDKITCSRCNTVITNSTTIPALGHDIVYDEGYDATCSMPGLTTGERCSRCDYKVTQQEIAKLPHTEVVDNAVSVTCTTNGYTEGKHCSVCGEVTMPQETIYATGHAEVKLNAIAATCTSSGLTEGSQCSKCGSVLKAQTSIAAKGHTEVIDNAIAATCTSSGLTEGTHCSECGSVLKAQTSIAAKGHTVVQDSAIAATCTNEGRTAGSHCSVCNAIISGTSTIAKLDHDYDVEITNPQCVAPGSITYTCKSCGHTYSDPLDAMGHIDTNNNSVCDICDATLGKKVISIIDLSNNLTPITIETECMTWEDMYHSWSATQNNINMDLYISSPQSPMHLTLHPFGDSHHYATIYGERELYTTYILTDKIIDKHTYYIATDHIFALSGKWIFNDEIELLPLTEEVDLKSNDTFYDILYVEPSYIRYDDAYVYSSNSGWRPDYQIVDFGVFPQAVSETFYNWFVANAHPVNDETYKLSGKWKFVDAPAILNVVSIIDQQINFITNGEPYNEMLIRCVVSTGGINYYGDPNSDYIQRFAYSFDHNDIEISNNCWMIEEYKIVDFGLTEQVVSKEFYEWFTANATPYNEPTYVLSGKWQFNDTLTQTGWASDVTKHEYINFTVSYHNNDGSLYEAEKSFMTFGIRSFGGRTCSYFAMHNDAGSNGHVYAQYHYDGSNCEIISSGVTANTWWQNISNPVVDFGTNSQTVSQEFYEWFTANATPYEEPTYVLSGKWQFNEDLLDNVNTDNIIQPIMFTTNNVQYTEMHIPFQDHYSYAVVVQNINGSWEPLGCKTEDQWSFTWFNNEYRTVNFGAVPQEVSKEFYDWFTANATQQDQNNDNTTCNHDKTITILKESTCSEMGLQLIVCTTCKISKYETIAKIPHTIQKIDAIAATCSEFGKSEGQQCSVCKEYIVRPSTTSKIPHTIQKIAAIAATCTESGKSEGQQCSVCKEYIVRPSTIAALGHDFKTQSTTNATCLTDGLSIDKCNRCGEIMNTTLKAPGHIDKIKDGYCDVCNTEIEYTFILDGVEYKYKYNMTFADWINSQYNPRKELIILANHVFIIHEESQAISKARSVTIKNNTLCIDYISANTALNTISSISMVKATNSFIIIDSNGTATNPYSMGYQTFNDVVDAMKNQDIVFTMYNNKAYYSYDDCVNTINYTMYLNGYVYSTGTWNLIAIVNETHTFPSALDEVKWYLADSNGNPTGDLLGSSHTFTASSDMNVVFMVTWNPTISFIQIVTGGKLTNTDIYVYDKETGALVNKYTTDNNGVATLAGLKPGHIYLVKSPYETHELSMTEELLKHERTSPLYNITLNVPTSGVVHFYDINNNLIGTVNITNGQIKATLSPGEYIMRVNNQESTQTIVVHEDGTINLK